MYIKLLSFLFAVILLSGCSKPGEDNEQAQVLTNISALADGKKLDFKEVKITYYVNFKTFVLDATTIDDKMFKMGVYVSSDGEGSYEFEPLGTNTAIYYYPGYNSFSDYNRSSLTGELTISKLDLNTEQASGTFHVKTYNSGMDLYHDITNGFFDDIKIDTSLSENYGNYLSCETSMGNQWITDRVPADILINSATDDVIRVQATTSIGMRFLEFIIPLGKGTGTFNLMDGDQSEVHNVSYSMHREKFYHPDGVAGTITITELNQATRTLKAVFNVELKDDAGDIISFTNGELRLDHWGGD